MITVKISGGLGNQMFQYALGKALAEAQGVSLQLDLAWFDFSGASQKRSFSLDSFPLIANIKKIHVESERGFYSKFLRRLELSAHSNVIAHCVYFVLSGGLKLTVERKFRFDSKILTKKGNLFLAGYWQSYKYFNLIETEIRKDFTFLPLKEEKNIQLAEKLKNSNSVSVHIRRGDYVGNPLHDSVSVIDYILSAISFLRKKNSDIRLFCFSDDIEWARDNLKTDLPLMFVDWNSEMHSICDMQLMSLCKYHIIANSTFSWWAAWLDDKADKLVIVPKLWFADPTISSEDLIPQNWLRM